MLLEEMGNSPLPPEYGVVQRRPLLVVWLIDLGTGMDQGLDNPEITPNNGKCKGRFMLLRGHLWSVC